MPSHSLTLSLGVAFALGFFHALEPGHGKTALFIHAAGRPRNRLLPLTMGLSTAISHTISLLAIAVLVHTATHVATGDHFHEDDVFRWLQIASSGLIMTIGVGVIVVGARRGDAAPCSCCRHGHGEDETATTLPENSEPAGRWTTDLRVTALLGTAVGLLPCPSALAAYFAGLSRGGPADAYWGVAAFGLGIALSLALAGLLLQYIGTSLRHRSHRLASPSTWSYIRGGLFVAIGLAHLLLLHPEAATHTH